MSKHNSRIDDDRRKFLKQSAKIGLAASVMPIGINLATLGQAAAQTAKDYKALVCVFLAGGNDYANTVINYDNINYQNYSTARGSIAIPRNNLSATRLLNADKTLKKTADGKAYALHPELKKITKLFNIDKSAAILFNVGPLEPSDLEPRPKKLLSHNDQTYYWQTFHDEGGAASGWAGNLENKMASSSGSTILSMAINNGGIFVTGGAVYPYQLADSNVDTFYSINPPPECDYLSNTDITNALATLWNKTSTHVFESEYVNVIRRAKELSVKLKNATQSVNINTPFPETDLGRQMKLIAQTIASRKKISPTISRQVFIVTLPGFDTHDNLLARHGLLLSDLDNAIGAFYLWTEESGLQNQVTTFTASEFGRTLSANSDGSDHGWGGHHFIIGGAVDGNKFYGTPPSTNLGEDSWHIGQGRLIPTTSVNQYAATLGKWFGVSDADLNTIIPGLDSHFNTPDYPRDLKFMKV